MRERKRACPWAGVGADGEADSLQGGWLGAQSRIQSGSPSQDPRSWSEPKVDD